MKGGGEDGQEKVDVTGGGEDGTMPDQSQSVLNLINNPIYNNSQHTAVSRKPQTFCCSFIAFFLFFTNFNLDI